MKKILSILIALLLISAGAYGRGRAPRRPQRPPGWRIPPVSCTASTTSMARQWISRRRTGSSSTGCSSSRCPRTGRTMRSRNVQSENGMIACFGDGSHFMFVGSEGGYRRVCGT